MNNKKNMSINKLFNITFMLVGIMFIGFVAIGFLMISNQQKLVESQEQRYESYLLADEMRQSSDDLTRLARTYVVTGDKKYEDYYMEILAIRNGDQARPEDYQRIYWDLVISEGKKPRPDSNLKKSLNDLMKEAGFTDEEFKKLTEAGNNSDGLVSTEVAAMNAIKHNTEGAESMMLPGESDEDFARRVMFDTQYHSDKGSIVKPIDIFFDMLDTRTSKVVEDNLQSRKLF